MPTTNSIIDTDNSESLSRAVYPLLELLKCFLIPLKNNFPDQAIAIFSERFIAYIPDQIDNLDNINYASFIIGSKSHKLAEVYENLLGIWKELQNYGLLGSDYQPDIEAIQIRVQKSIDEITAII